MGMNNFAKFTRMDNSSLFFLSSEAILTKSLIYYWTAGSCVEMMSLIYKKFEGLLF